jgi:hypothetical protein
MMREVANLASSSVSLIINGLLSKNQELDFLKVSNLANFLKFDDVRLHQVDEAHRVAWKLLDQPLTVCVNGFPVNCADCWQGKITEDPEVVLVIERQAGYRAQIETTRFTAAAGYHGWAELTLCWGASGITAMTIQHGQAISHQRSDESAPAQWSSPSLAD